MLAVSLTAIFVLSLVADAASYVVSGVKAATAADAAALAAAPLTFRPFGPGSSPRREAARFASLNEATLVACDCAVGRGWGARTVRVVVEVSWAPVLLGGRPVRAVGRAEFTPTRLH